MYITIWERLPVIIGCIMLLRYLNIGNIKFLTTRSTSFGTIRWVNLYVSVFTTGFIISTMFNTVFLQIFTDAYIHLHSLVLLILIGMFMIVNVIQGVFVTLGYTHSRPWYKIMLIVLDMLLICFYLDALHLAWLHNTGIFQ